jgi:hypothetical protein
MSENLKIEFGRVELVDLLNKISVKEKSTLMFTPIVFAKVGDKLIVNQLDQQKVGFTNADITPVSMEGGSEGMKFALNPEKVVSLLKSDNSEGVTLKITSKSIEMRTSNGKYDLMLEEYEEGLVKPPKVKPEDYEFAYVAVASDVQQAIKQGSDFSLDKFLFEIKGKKLQITAGVIEKNALKITRTIPGAIDKVPTKDTRCFYNERVGKMLNQLSGEIIIRFGFDMPIMITGESEKLKIMFVLAPMNDEPEKVVVKPEVISSSIPDTPQTIREEDKAEIKTW